MATAELSDASRHRRQEGTGELGLARRLATEYEQSTRSRQDSTAHLTTQPLKKRTPQKRRKRREAKSGKTTDVNP
jgi:hypothetical protein